MHTIHTLCSPHSRTHSFHHRIRLARRFVLAALVTMSALFLGGCGSAQKSPDPSAASSVSAGFDSDSPDDASSSVNSDSSADSASAANDSATADSGSARSVFSVLGPDAEAFAASWEESNVTQVVWIRNYETSETITLSASAPEIQELFRALSELQIGEPTDEAASDSEDIITVTMNDGSSLTFTFNSGNLVSGNTIYQTSGKKALYELSKTLF